MSKKRTWWALYWPRKRDLGIWSVLQHHEMYLYPTKKAAQEDIDNDWSTPNDGPIPRRIMIDVYGEK